MLFRNAIISTLLLSAAFLSSVPLAHAADPFVDVVKGETNLKMVFDHGDVCEFIIAGDDAKETAAAVSQKITTLYDKKPALRGTTRSWDIDNTKAKSNQAKTVSILIKQERDGQYRLVMDRRRGGERHNSQKTKTNPSSLSQLRSQTRSQARSQAAPARAAMPPKPTPPPALID